MLTSRSGAGVVEGPFHVYRRETTGEEKKTKTNKREIIIAMPINTEKNQKQISSSLRINTVTSPLSPFLVIRWWSGKLLQEYFPTTSRRVNVSGVKWTNGHQRKNCWKPRRNLQMKGREGERKVTKELVQQNEELGHKTEVH